MSSGQRILVTGATGFIGSRLARRLHAAGNPLVLLGRRRNEVEEERSASLSSLGLTVNDIDLVTQELATFVDGVDLIIHLAAAQHEANRPESYFEEINVGGTRRLLEAAVAAGVRRFVYGSTIGVYGQALDGEIDENSRVAPDNHYGRTKLAAEETVRQFGDRIEVAIARISETYGPGDHRLLKLFSGIQKGVFFVIGSGQNQHQLVYVDDLVDGLYELGTNPEAAGQTIVLAGDEVISTKAMCESISTAVGRPLRRFRSPLWPFVWIAVVLENTLGRAGIQPPLHRRRLDFFRKSFYFSPAQRNRLLQWRPKVGFDEGTRHTAEWYAAAGLLNKTEYLSETGQRSNAMQTTAPIKDQNFQAAKSNRSESLTARIEPFDSYWQAPDDIEAGYSSFAQYYLHNYLKHLPDDKSCSILVISCGPGYLVDLLKNKGYNNVLGIDSDESKIAYARKRELNCRSERAFEHLDDLSEQYDVIIPEQELNHLTHAETLEFLALCHKALKKDGLLVVYGLNGANPLVGSENLAHNIDHFYTMTEYSLNQMLEYAHFRDIKMHPLKLYVFWKNPLNYVGLAVTGFLHLCMRAIFILYGKKVTILTKKIMATCRK